MMSKRFVKIKLGEYGESLGPREIGRNICKEAMSDLKEGKKILFSFHNVHLITSGFADELFGELFVQLGEETFRNNIQLNDFDNEKDKDFVINTIKRSLEYRKRKTS